MTGSFYTLLVASGSAGATYGQGLTRKTLIWGISYFRKADSTIYLHVCVWGGGGGQIIEALEGLLLIWDSFVKIQRTFRVW